MKIDDHIMRMHQTFLDAAQFTFNIIMERKQEKMQYLGDDLKKCAEELQRILDLMD